MFTFNVISKGQIISTAETSATGTSKCKLKFTPVKYTLDDLKKADGTYMDKRTFKYIIRENISPGTDRNGYDSIKSIQYDTKERKVTVTLKLVDDQLVADVDYGDDGRPVFKNSKNPPGPPPETPPEEPATGDNTNMLAWIALMLTAILMIPAVIAIYRRKTEKI